MEEVQKIRSTPLGSPEKLFSSPDVKVIEKEFRQWARLCHPDANASISTDVFSHLVELRDAALNKAKSKAWIFPKHHSVIYHPSGYIAPGSPRTVCHTFSFQERVPTECGETFFASTQLTFVFNREYGDLYRNATNTTNLLIYADDNMKKEIKRYLPVHLLSFEGEDKRYYLTVQKGETDFTLRRVLEDQGGKLPARQVAWILNRLYNLCCYFHYAKISHNAISLDSIFIDPMTHATSLLGGWEYTVRFGKRITALPSYTYNNLPKRIFESKCGISTIDLELVKLIGRELLGDRVGSRLLMNKEIPPAIAKFLILPSTGDAIEDYRAWNETIDDAFGKRKFVTMRRPNT